MFKVKEKLIELLNLTNDPGSFVVDERNSTEEIHQHLRTCIKYVLFERDALMRENRYYKTLLKGDDTANR